MSRLNRREAGPTLYVRSDLTKGPKNKGRVPLDPDSKPPWYLFEFFTFAQLMGSEDTSPGRESLVRESRRAGTRCEEADATLYVMQTLHDEEKTRLEFELKQAAAKEIQLVKEVDEKEVHINYLEKMLHEKEEHISLLEDELKVAEAEVRKGEIIAEKFKLHKEALKKMAHTGLGERKEEQTQALRQQAFEEKFDQKIQTLRGLNAQSQAEITTQLADVTHVVQATSTSVNNTTSQVLEKLSVLEQILWGLRESTLHQLGDHGGVGAARDHENIVSLTHERHVSHFEEGGQVNNLPCEQTGPTSRNALYGVFDPENSPAKMAGQVVLCSETGVVDGGQGHLQPPPEGTKLFTHAMSTYLEDLKQSTAEYSSKLLTLEQGIRDIHDLMLCQPSRSRASGEQSIRSTIAHTDHHQETSQEIEVASRNSVSTQTEENEEPKALDAAQIADKISVLIPPESSTGVRNNSSKTFGQTHVSELDTALADTQTSGTRWEEMLQVAQADATERRHVENAFGDVSLPSLMLSQEYESAAKLVKTQITDYLANFGVAGYYILAAKHATPKCIVMVLSLSIALYLVVGLGDLCGPRVYPQEGLDLRQDSITSLFHDIMVWLMADWWRLFGIS